MSTSFADYYGSNYGVDGNEGAARIALIEALRPHLSALRSLMRQRYATHIDRSAGCAPASLESYIWAGRGKEASSLADDFEHHTEMLDSLHSEWLSQFKEEQK